MSRVKPAATILRSRDFISRIVFFGWEISQMSRVKPAATSLDKYYPNMGSLQYFLLNLHAKGLRLCI